MFCVEDHNGNKSWTLLYLMSFYLCKAFDRYNLINQIKIKLFKNIYLYDKNCYIEKNAKP